MRIKAKIKKYWETPLPQRWYSDLKPFTFDWARDISFKRYNVFYPSLLEDAEFKTHEKEKVLEIGCGIGTDAAQFARYGALVTATDLTEQAVRDTERYFKALGFVGNFLRADAENLPFDDGEFDFVFSFGTLHHTPDTLQALKEVRRVLRKDGTAVIGLYNKGLEYWRNVLANYVLGGEWRNGSLQDSLNTHSEVKGNCPLAKYYTRSDVEKLFKEAGFSDIMVWCRRMGWVVDADFSPDGKVRTTFWRMVVRLNKALRLERWLGDMIMIKVRK